MARKYVWGSALAIGLLASASAMAASAAATSKSTAQPGTTIVDSKGTVLGNLYGYTWLRQINGTWYAVESGLNRDGLCSYQPNSQRLFYTSSNCQGTAYMDGSQMPLVANIVTTGGNCQLTTATISYPAAPIQSIPIGSFTNDGGTTCYVWGGILYDVGLLATQTVTVVPPLSVQ